MHEAIQHGAKDNIGTIETEKCWLRGLEKAYLSTRIFVLPKPFPFFLKVHERMQALRYSHITGFVM